MTVNHEAWNNKQSFRSNTHDTKHPKNNTGNNNNSGNNNGRINLPPFY